MGRAGTLHFVAKLHELEVAENVTRTVRAAVVDEHWKTMNQGPWQPRFNNQCPPREFQRMSAQPQNVLGDRRPADRQVKGKGPSPDSICYWCQGKGHYSGSLACPMYGKDGERGWQLQDWLQLKVV